MSYSTWVDFLKVKFLSHWHIGLDDFAFVRRIAVRVLLVSLLFQGGNSVRGSSSYRDIVGTPPLPTQMVFKDWVDRLVDLRLKEVPVLRPLGYYFSQGGSDSLGDGTMERPWRSLEKAQSVLDSYANALDTTESGRGIGLYFRAGDIWRDPVVLKAVVERQVGNRIWLNPKPEWRPQPGFAILLEGAAGEERVNVKSYDREAGAVELEWAPTMGPFQGMRFVCGLLIRCSHVTIGSYGEPGKSLKAKPRFTLFRVAQPWKTSRDRGDAFVRAYTLEVGSSVGWIRALGILDKCFRKVDSVEEVDSNPGTWYWDGQRVWAREWMDSPMAGGLNQYEWVEENRWDGICIGDVGDVRIDSILVDGWGMTSQASGEGDQRGFAGYGIRSTASGVNHIVLSECEAYYHNRHCMGNVTDGSGGIWTVSGCSWGYCVEGGNAVSYASRGGNEALFFENWNRAGNVLHGVKPYRGNLAVAGYSHHCHTAGGTNRVALFLSYRCKNVPSLTMGGHCGPADVPSADVLGECRSFVVEDEFRIRVPGMLDRLKPAMDGSPGVLSPGFADHTVYINCWMETGLMWGAGNWVPVLNRRFNQTRLINCVITYKSLVDDYYGSIPQVAWEIGGLEAIHCHMDMQVGTGRTYGFVGSAAGKVTNQFRHSILTFRGGNVADPGMRMVMRSSNEDGSLWNNFYGGFTENGGEEGYDRDGARVEGLPFEPGVTPGRSSLLVTGYRLGTGRIGAADWKLEYDRGWSARGDTVTAIGPVECAAKSEDDPSLSWEAGKLEGNPLFILSSSQPAVVRVDSTTGNVGQLDWRTVAWMRINSNHVGIVEGESTNRAGRFFRASGW